MPILTYAIMAITAITSYMAFNNPGLKEKLMFHPFTIKRENEWFRFLGHGFIHADMTHLIFNMITLFSFGPLVEYYFKAALGDMIGSIHFLILYFLGMILASAYTYFKHQNDFTYRALGASGAVSAILFAGIILKPQMMFIFPPIPAILFGPLYLYYCFYMGRKGMDNIGHDAHFFGAVFGIIYTLVFYPNSVTQFLGGVNSFIETVKSFLL